jgi:integrase/recombinase XerD
VTPPSSEIIVLGSPADDHGRPLTVAERIDALLEHASPTGHTLHQLVQAWLSEVTNSDETRKTYLVDIRQHFQFCAEHDLDPLTLTKVEFSIFKGWLQTQTTRTKPPRPYSEQYRRRKIMVTASFYKYLVEVDARSGSPATRLPKQPESTTDKALTPQQVDALFASINAGDTNGDDRLTPRALLVAAHLMFLGLRVSEVCALNLSDLFTVEQRDGTSPCLALRYQAKGGKPMVRPIPHEVARDALLPYLHERPQLDGEQALLITAQGTRPSRFQFYRALGRAGRRAGLDDVTPHSGRHTFKADAEDAGIPIDVIRTGLGHASVEVTQLYGRVRRQLSEDAAHAVSAQRARRQAQATTPDTTAPDTTAPDTTAPITAAPDTAAPDLAPGQQD